VPVDLIEICNAAAIGGASFPTIWNHILSHSAWVKGTPVQASAGRLEVPLIDGRRLIYQSDKKTFSVG
jgi:hypothetical protein